MCLDDYFDCDGEYEYEEDMEEAYRSDICDMRLIINGKMFRASFLKSFKKNIDAGLFSFLIVDAVHCKTSQYREFWSYAKQNGYEVRELTLLIVISTLTRPYILELETKRNFAKFKVSKS